jgi:hypothetical protein
MPKLLVTLGLDLHPIDDNEEGAAAPEPLFGHGLREQL